ncbi:MAG TPA: hypothetical protein IAC17_07435 [Candidatus Faecousia faecipullorum]|nr:hypothetical protein [Candidatus Faecousia faecipullorum]
MKIGKSVLCLLMALCLLSGCGASETPPAPETTETVTQATEVTQVTEETQSAPDAQATVTQFAEAYFAGDADTLKTFLSGDFTGSVTTYDPTTGPVLGEIIKGLGVPEDMVRDGWAFASVEFRSTPEFDNYRYLQVNLVLEDGQWKVASYEET